MDSTNFFTRMRNASPEQQLQIVREQREHSSMSLDPALETPSADEWREIHRLRQQGKWLTPEEAKREHSGEAPPATWHPLLDDETWMGPYEVGMYAWLVDDEANPAPQLLPEARMQLIRKAFNHLSSDELVELRASISNQLAYRDMKGEDDA